MIRRCRPTTLDPRSLLEALERIPPLRVVLAEDDPQMRALMASVLRRDGFEVIEATNGRQLLELLGAGLLDGGRPDLVVSDVRMPGATGLEALAGLRRADWAVPFILMTAFGDDGVRAEARRLGAVAVFDKPFDLDDFRTAVLAALGGD